ncbi:unnamed protein product, partial [Rotaria sp. Silwood1]
IYGYVNI